MLSGSHTDAIPLAGMYDGSGGVIGALESVRALKAAGYQPKRSLEVSARVGCHMLMFFVLDRECETLFLTSCCIRSFLRSCDNVFIISSI